MVATSRLEEFRLETRLKYLQDYLNSDHDHESTNQSIKKVSDE